MTLKQLLAAVLCLNMATILSAGSALKPTGKTVELDNIKSHFIVIPENATEQEKYSASMLSEYLGKIYDSKFQIVQEPGKAEGKIISIGNTAAAKTAGINPDPREQAYKLAAANGNLYIHGGTRGPIYGVIALLEEDLGCRWYAKNDKPVIPVCNDDKLSFVPRSYSPPFEIREPHYSSALHNEDWAAFNRLQPVSYWINLSFPKGGGLSNTGYFIHTYDQLIPADKYFKEHPEYFPIRDGKRVPSKQTNGQLCYTCPGMIDTIVQELDAAIAKKPGSRIYSVSANDNVYSNCECESCQKIIKADGLSGAQLNLANEVAKRLAVKYPDIKITTLAYVNTQTPTKTIKPGPNTVIIYAPIVQRGNPINMLEPLGSIKQIEEELAGWHKIAKNIYFWDYVGRVGPAPFSDFDAIDRGWDFLVKNGVTGVFLQNEFRGRTSMTELKTWLNAKKMWNPRWPQRELMKEFIDAYYGPAAKEMNEYVNLQRRHWAFWYLNRKPGERLIFTDFDKEEMHKLLTAAIERCGNDAEHKTKVEQELVSWYYMMLSTFPTKETAAEYEKNLKELSELATKLKLKYFGEGSEVNASLQGWTNRLKDARGEKKLPQYSENSIQVKKPGCYEGSRYLPDADATLGHATRQPAHNSAWGVQWQYDNFIDLLKPEEVYILRIRCKPEIKTTTLTDNAKNLFGLGCYNFGVGGNGFTDVKFVPEDNGKYSWVNLFKLQVVTPGMTGYFYSVVGDKLKAEDAVWYDYIELVPEKEFKDKEEASKLPLVKI